MARYELVRTQVRTSGSLNSQLIIIYEPRAISHPSAKSQPQHFCRCQPEIDGREATSFAGKPQPKFPGLRFGASGTHLIGEIHVIKQPEEGDSALWRHDDS
jgi:hypothetical protein